ncbi:UNVERIFIED_CONTAM: Retrovirus-related Pol polyprotein from transposon.6 [Sesamum angustifolium]|uniref:Retrovirus-related Pol polyprotein from transposon.6 n=1 Tax=Sesamum angustifolium TaxID=2727405 RepID=A0AAW2K5M8_9LAMI
MSFKKFLVRWRSSCRSSRMSSLLNCLRSYPHGELSIMLLNWSLPHDRQFVVVYLDDIVIYSETLNEHVKHLRAIFQRLREYELYAKKENCEFLCEQITFLGYVISQGKIQMDRKKAVHQGILENCKPLKDLLRKDHKWEQTVACDDAFRSLKQAISSQPVLKLPQFDKPFEVQVDASDRALGGVLVQDKHPVAFESRKLKDAELWYNTHEKKMTVVIHCLEAWKTIC